MTNTPQSEFARRAAAQAERSPLIQSKDRAEWSNLRTRAVVRQARVTVARAVKSEKTDDAGRPK